MYLIENIDNLAKYICTDKSKFLLLVVSGECIWEENLCNDCSY